METNRIPNSLKFYRRRQGLKQTDVARVLGIRNASMISRWEKGISIPNTVNVFKLALIYRITADALYADYCLSLKHAIRQREDALNLS